MCLFRLCNIRNQGKCVSSEDSKALFEVKDLLGFL